MKRLCILFCMLFIIGLTGCGDSGSSDDGEANDSGRSPSEAVTLELDSEVRTFIDSEGEVDWYQYSATEIGRTLKVNMEELERPSKMAFSIAVYELQDSGELTPIIGWVAPDTGKDGVQHDEVDLYIPIERRRNLRIAVRDFMDNDYDDRLPYKLHIAYEVESPDGNNSSFASATEIGVNQCQADAISSDGVYNVHTFNIINAGIYRLTASFDGDPGGVALGMDLFDASANRLHRFNGSTDNYFFLSYLEPGQYFLASYDQGRDDSSDQPYQVCVTPVAGDSEANENDNLDAAGGLDGEVRAALSYMEDQDWYSINVPADEGETVYNLHIEFQPDYAVFPDALRDLSDMQLGFHVAVRDAQGTVLYEFDHPASDLSREQIDIGRGVGNEHFVTVTPTFGQNLEEMPYQLSLTAVGVNDPNEQEGCYPLTSGMSVTGKIAKIGDIDRYCISAGTDTGPKILKVNLTAPVSESVDFVGYVSYGITEPFLLRDKYRDVSERAALSLPLNIRSSYFLNLDNTNQNSQVTIDVMDAQNNSGDTEVAYTLTVETVNVPAALPAMNLSGTPVDSGNLVFHSEIDEFANTAKQVTVVEYKSRVQPSFNVNTTHLRPGVLAADAEWTSPWIAGYVDYVEDRDIFQLILDDTINSQAEGSNYYFDIKVQLYAPASEVEPCWILFRDGDAPAGDVYPNDILLERTLWGDGDEGVFHEYNNGEGIVAADGDPDFSPTNVVDRTVPANEDQEIWISQGWRQSNFFFSMQDFNRVAEYVGETRVPTTTPDNDAGYDAPYFFQVTVTFHTGAH